MDKQIEILKKSRILLLKVIENLTIEQLNEIPLGFKNNIVWNIAHLVVTQQLLCYKLSGLECLVNDKMVLDFQKGTVPSYAISEVEFEKIKKQFLEFPDKLNEDYNSKIFKSYIEYTTSVNVTLKSIEDGITFNILHEGIHLGVILQLLKFIKKDS